MLDVAQIPRGDQHSGNSVLMRRDELLFYAPDGEHQPAQRNLAGHRGVHARGPPAEQRHEGAAHGDPRAGTVLGYRALGEVDVDVATAK